MRLSTTAYVTHPLLNLVEKEYKLKNSRKCGGKKHTVVATQTRRNER
jgi:hypothetical protein